MPVKLAMSCVRGDALLIYAPITSPGPPVRPATAAEAQAMKDAWPNISMQVRQNAADTVAPLLSLTAAAGQISFQTAYLMPNGTLAPALLISADSSLTQTVIDGAVYDIEFSGPGSGPYTWITGTFAIKQDVNRVTP